jgi:hypothetical protein
MTPVRGALAAEPPGGSLATLAVPTRNRTAVLERCLRTYAANAASHGRDLRLLVVDDSDHAEVREANRRVLTSVGRRHGLRCRYSGPADRRRFVRELAVRTGVPKAVVEFALLNAGRLFAPGCLRNTVLLHTAGELAVMADDDTLCALGRRPATPSGPALAAAAGFEVSFLPPGWLRRTPVRFHDADFLALHEELLGRAVGVSGAGEGTPPRVLTTALGYVGDSGMDSPALHLLLDHGSLEQLFRQVRRHGRIWESGQLLRVVARQTIARRAVCMAGSLGVDNRRALPPFLPVLRNEDAVFGRLLPVAHPEGLFGLQPWVVRHHRPPSARGVPRPEPRPGSSCTGEVVSFLIDIAPPPAGGAAPHEALAGVARWLLQLVDGGPQGLLELLMSVRARVVGTLARLLERNLAEHPGAPGAWRDDVRQLVWRCRHDDAAPAAALPTDLRAFDTPARRLAALDGLLRDLAALLFAWPALHSEAARRRCAPPSTRVGAGAGARVSLARRTA